MGRYANCLGHINVGKASADGGFFVLWGFRPSGAKTRRYRNGPNRVFGFALTHQY